MKPATVLVRLAALAWIAVLGIADAAEVFVSPDGNDAHPGSRERPLATLPTAIARTRQLRRESPAAALTIRLAGGYHLLTGTLVIGPEDSPAPGGSLTLAAVPGESPVIGAGVPVRDWQRLENPPPELPATARGKVWVARMPEGIGRFRALFDRAGLLPCAQTTPFRHTRDSRNWTGPQELHDQLPFEPSIVEALFRPPAAEVLVVGAAPWTINRLPVAAVDSVTGIVRFGARATYALARPRFYMGPDSIWVENTFAGLDSPGEWVVDPDLRRVYLWPRDETPGNGIVAPALVELVRVEGGIDAAGPSDVPVRGIAFQGLTFRHGDRYESAGQTGLGLQHDWERFDAPTAMLRFRGAEDCAVEDCRFEHAGGTALRLDLHARRLRLVGNEIAWVGGAGILLAGYGPGTKDVNRDHVVTDNHVHHTGQLWWHAPAIWAWQSGHNRIAHNHVHHVPYTAIAVTGRIAWDRGGRAECAGTVRWHEVGPVTGGSPWEEREPFLHARANRIEHNDLHHVMEVLQDGNAVYVSGAGAGNIVRGNFAHDVPSEAAGEAIRCDDDQHDTQVVGNLVFRYGTHGIGLCTKGRNHFLNNIVACPARRVNRGLISVETDARDRLAGSRIRNNIVYATGPRQPFHFRDVLAGGTPPRIEGFDLDRNLYWNASDPHAADAHLAWAREHGKERESLQADPRFVDPEAGDFRLGPDSPALRLGFEPLSLQPGIRPRNARENPASVER